ncbi:MAG: hypothetical protein AAGK93_04320, partial [Pseudomonadota bacterium]
KVGSALYGPILGVFLMAILQSRRSEAAANIGLLVGLALNLYFWLFVPNLFWMWWNVIGLVVTLVTGAVVTLILSPPSRDEGRLLPQVQAPIVWIYSLALIAAFFVILGTSWGAPLVFG